MRLRQAIKIRRSPNRHRYRKTTAAKARAKCAWRFWDRRLPAENFTTGTDPMMKVPTVKEMLQIIADCQAALGAAEPKPTMIDYMYFRRYVIHPPRVINCERDTKGHQ